MMSIKNDESEACPEPMMEADIESTQTGMNTTGEDGDKEDTQWSDTATEEKPSGSDVDSAEGPLRNRR